MRLLLSASTRPIVRRVANRRKIFLNFQSTVALPSEKKPKTAIVMLNMGGPNDLEETGPFLENLFADGEIIQLGPLQNFLGPWIAKRRTPKVRDQYAEIGGRSPIRLWTEKQGKGMEKLQKEDFLKMELFHLKLMEK